MSSIPPRGSSQTADQAERPRPQQPQPQRVHWDQLPQAHFTDLGITKEMYARTGGARVRQHVNPLKKELQIPTGPLDWPATYATPSLPLVLDIGSGYGRFLLALAMAMPTHNGLGIEIREPVIDRANRWAKDLTLDSRVHFVRANATVSLVHMMESYPGSIDLVTIQYPDPHFKKRHRKRRIVQPQLVEAVARLLRPGARVLLQSDVLDVAEDMRDQFERVAGDAFQLAGAHANPSAVFHESSPAEQLPAGPAEGDDGDDGGVQDAADPDGETEWESTWVRGGWLVDNPLPVPTERELHVLSQGLPVYRVFLEKR